MKKFLLNPSHILAILLVTSFLLRLIGVGYPSTYIFDEVYYAFTAQEYIKGNPDAWGWWGSAPQGFAYAWVNPPLPQEIMALSMFLFQSQEPWAWRIPGVLAGTLSIYLIYLVGRKLFHNSWTAVLAAGIFSFDGLNFVQSRIGMIDIYLTTFILVSLLFLLKKDYITSAVFMGLAAGSKWTTVYLAPLIGLILIKQGSRKQLLLYVLIVPIVYLLIYLPFFLNGNGIYQYIELLRQQWWYHTNLKATHDYASAWWSWPLSLYPVWYYVQYYSNNLLSNIFAAGNPIVFWGGSIATLLCIVEFLRKKSDSLLIVILGVLCFWLPWAFSPRIMFFYYFAPAVPFISLALAYQLGKLWNNYRYLFWGTTGLIILTFFIFYPIYIGIPIPREWLFIFFGTNLSKNPFGG